jgi:hypothetical protein
MPGLWHPIEACNECCSRVIRLPQSRSAGLVNWLDLLAQAMPNMWRLLNRCRETRHTLQYHKLAVAFYEALRAAHIVQPATTDGINLVSTTLHWLVEQTHARNACTSSISD